VAADRVAFVISGAVTRAGMARVLKAQTALQELPATGDTGRLDFATPTEPETLQLKTLTLPTRQAQVMLGHLGIEGRPEDHAALEIMHHILAGGGFASRMMGLLRAERGITSALYGEVEPGRGAPNPYLWRFGGRPETLGEGIGLAMEQIRQLRDEGVTQEEFEAARTTFIDGLIPASYDTAHKIGLRLAHKAVFGQYAYQSPHYLNYYAGDADQVSALRELTLEDVNAAARKYLKPDQLVIVVSGQVDVVQKNTPSAVRERLGWTSP
jgi:predicted Zn-dependent peptidase